MSMTMRARFDVSNTQSFFQSLPRNAQKEIGNAMFTIAKNNKRGLRFALNRTSKRFDRKIWNGIKAKKISNNQSVVVMPKEGFWLDDMEPHFVSLKRGRKITAWAMQSHIKAEIRAMAKRGVGAIKVRPKPFILTGLKRGSKNDQKILDDAMDLAIKNSRR